MAPSRFNLPSPQASRSRLVQPPGPEQKLMLPWLLPSVCTDVFNVGVVVCVAQLSCLLKRFAEVGWP